MRRTEEVRADHNDAFFDVDYRKLMADPLGVSRELFEWLGTGLGEATESRMRCWLEDNPQGKHGVHRYDPADLGVTDDAVRGASVGTWIATVCFDGSGTWVWDLTFF